MLTGIGQFGVAFAAAAVSLLSLNIILRFPSFCQHYPSLLSVSRVPNDIIGSRRSTTRPVKASHSILFCSIPHEGIPLCSILFGSMQKQSAPFCLIPPRSLCFVPFRSVLFHSVLFCFIPHEGVPLYSVSFGIIRKQSTLFCCIPSRSTLFHPA